MTSHSIDSKGRIVLPAEFREGLGKTFYFARGFGNSCVQAVPVDVFEKICEQIQSLPAKLSMALQYTFSATAIEVTQNAQGRVIIPQALREIACLENEAIVIGMDTRIEIWDKQKYEEYMLSQSGNITEALGQISF